MSQTELVSIGNELAVLAFCSLAKNNIELWHFQVDQRVHHIIHGDGTIQKVWQSQNGIGISVAFDHDQSDFPRSFKDSDLNSVPSHWHITVPDGLIIPDDDLRAAQLEIANRAQFQIESAIQDQIREQELDALVDRRNRAEEEKREAERRRQEECQKEADAQVARHKQEKAERLRELTERTDKCREAISEVYYITPIHNLASILCQGILSHERAEILVPEHRSVAMEEVQIRRASRTVMYRPLHSYANLYFNARNPMLYKLKGDVSHLCVLGISESILDQRGVVISDGNAASSNTKVMYSPVGLLSLEWAIVNSRSWFALGDEERTQYQKRTIMAEVLVPDLVDSGFIAQIYVSSMTSAERVSEMLRSLNRSIPIQLDPDLFFVW